MPLCKEWGGDGMLDLGECLGVDGVTDLVTPPPGLHEAGLSQRLEVRADGGLAPHDAQPHGISQGAKRPDDLGAGILLLRWQPPRTAHTPTEPTAATQPPVNYRTVLTDRALMGTTAINAVFVLCASVLTVLMSVYIVTTLHQPAWLAGAARCRHRLDRLVRPAVDLRCRPP